MRKIILYFRSLFCNHDWEYITKSKFYESAGDSMPHKVVVVYRCKKCGYVQRVRLL